MKLQEEDILVIKGMARFWSHKVYRSTKELEQVISTHILELPELELRQRTQYIRTVARNAIKRFLTEKDITITVKIDARRRHNIVDRKRVHLNAPGNEKGTQWSRSKEYEPECPCMGPQDTAEIKDSLIHAAKTPIEIAYMHCRIAGLTNQETIVELNISDSVASRLLRTIEKRFREDWYG